MNKKIWLFHHYADPPIGTWLGSHEQYSHLLKLGNEITIFCSNYNHYSHQNLVEIKNNYYKIEYFEGIRYVIIKTFPYRNNGISRLLNMISYAINCIISVKKIKDEPDVIIATTPHPFSLLSGLILSKKMKKYFVIELHDLWTEYIYDFSKNIFIRIFAHILRQLDSYIYKKADYIFYLWQNMNKYLISLNCDKNKLKWTPLGVENIIEVGTNDTRCKKFIVTCTARFGPASNIIEILKVAKLLSKLEEGENIEFILAGGGPHKNNLEEYCRVNKLKNVKFPGMIKKSEIPNLLEGSSVLIATLPDVRHYNIYGTIPTKVIDYLASGKPTIFVSKIKNNIVDISGGGFSIYPGEIEKMAEKILFLKNLPYDEYCHFGRSGTTYIKNNHFLPRLTKKIDDDLNQLFYTVKGNTSL